MLVNTLQSIFFFFSKDRLSWEWIPLGEGAPFNFTWSFLIIIIAGIMLITSTIGTTTCPPFHFPRPSPPPLLPPPLPSLFSLSCYVSHSSLSSIPPPPPSLSASLSILCPNHGTSCPSHPLPPLPSPPCSHPYTHLKKQQQHRIDLHVHISQKP